MTQASNTVLRRPTSPKAHASTVEALERELDTSAVLGLSDEDAAARLLEDGPNRLSRPERPPYGRIALRQLIDPLVGLLVVAAIVSAGIGEGLEAAVIAAIVLLNGVLGFVQEVRSERAVLALREGFEQTARVVRGGRMQEVRSDEIVPGTSCSWPAAIAWLRTAVSSRGPASTPTSRSSRGVGTGHQEHCGRGRDGCAGRAHVDGLRRHGRHERSRSGPRHGHRARDRDRRHRLAHGGG